jgi:hypothetical protein
MDFWHSSNLIASWCHQNEVAQNKYQSSKKGKHCLENTSLSLFLHIYRNDITFAQPSLGFWFSWKHTIVKKDRMARRFSYYHLRLGNKG